MTYTYKTTDGLLHTVSAKDADRARCAAKKAALAAGSPWARAKLVKITNAIG